MISLSRETKDLIYKTLNALEKTPKVKDVDEGLKELIRHELHSKQLSDYYTYGSTYMWNKGRNKINITDKLVNSYIGVILKQIRIEKRKTIFLGKRVSSVKNRGVVMQYYNMSIWESIKYPNKVSRLRCTSELVRIEFTQLIVNNKEITIDKAAEQIIKKYTEELRRDLQRYISHYFK
jgi:hypothetical protein